MSARTRIARPVALVAKSSLIALLCAAPFAVAEPVDFVRDVQPILRKNCFECHGPEEQEAGLRLDARSVVFAGGDSGPAVEPGSSKTSLLIELVTSNDEDERMPQDADPLDPLQINILRAWIDQGAHWPDGVGVETPSNRLHWAYRKPKAPKLPPVKSGSWVRNEIDRFVLARIEAEHLAPSPPAERARLLRRLHLDLVGLPPSLAEVDAFVADPSPDAHEKTVDRLLGSQHYGERWAVPWLDAARYADSHGYQSDNIRDAWPYRDWVIDALNRDMPFDQFTIEQIAGDLLPNATLQQKLATGFHRGAPTNLESGANPEEYRVNQVVDRVNVTGSVWLGSTVACAQCHSHKYDPFSQREYYQLFAYFNNTPIETALLADATASVHFIGPWLSIELRPAELSRRRKLNGRIASTQTLLDKRQSELDPADEKQRLQLRRLSERLETLQFHRERILEARALVMVEDTPRASHVLKRGDFLNPGELVQPGTPDALHPMPTNAPANRLGLARWLVSPENPLVARVTVNRAWAEFFGRGIVMTQEDFGTRGEPPTHPALLDWLAVDFMSNGWSMKQLHKKIVMSATYRQSSRVAPEDLKRDPQNELYARGPRFRLAAEFVRDNALAVSGLIDLSLHGPPTFPPQPDGFWRMTADFSGYTYVESKGRNRYRRGLYTIWRRSSPYPSFTNFDAPDRAASCARRSRTNTALQALNLLNDPVYVEAAIALARRIHEAPGLNELPEKLRFGLRLALAREPSAPELQRLEELYLGELVHFGENPDQARELLEGWDLGEAENASELAAWFSVASVLLNLDETITKG